MSQPTDFIPFARPVMGKEEEEAALRVIRSGWLTTGKEAAAFEEEFAAKLGCPRALAVNSATSGLHLALEALNIPEDSWVITTPFTFTASAEIIRYRRAHPLFVDIEEGSLNIDPVEIEKVLAGKERKVSCVLPVHLGGLPCDMEAITDLAEKYRIPVVEDCAHAFPAHRGGKAAGTWGDASVFSFYATKTITTGEGGMLVTSRPDIARTVENLRLHGIDRPVWDRFQSRRRGAWEYDVTAPGYKYNLPDLAAAIGRVQLGKADEFLKERTRMADYYREQLKDIEGLILPASREGHAWHLFIIQLVPPFPLDRDRFMVHMADQGVGTSVHYKPLHLMSYYAGTYGLKPRDFPRAYQVFTRCVSLPLYPGMGPEALDRVVEAVRKAANLPGVAGGEE